MELLLTKILTALVLPPGSNLLLCVLGLLLMLRWRRLGTALVAVGVLSLVVLSLPVVGGGLQRALPAYPALSSADLKRHDVGAIVVLAGGRYANAPEYGADTIGSISLVRVRYAARLYRQTGLPVLVSGGTVFGGGSTVSEASLMKEALEEDFHVPVTWIEERSRNTAENAAYSATILRAAGVRTFFLITDANHMVRAVEAFRRDGLDPVPAPTEFVTVSHNAPAIFGWLPTAGALGETSSALYEYLGLAWYRLRY